MRCNNDEGDFRTLYMKCGYDMNELEIPFITDNDQIMIHRGPFFMLSVCKDCRSQWMKAIKHWFENIEPKREVGTGIFIREYGANVEITRAEWDEKIHKQRLKELSK